MDNMTLPERNTDEKVFQFMMAQYGTPAFARRALRIHEALNDLLAHCRLRREQWFADGRLVFEDLASQIADWPALSPFLASPEQVALFPRYQGLLNARAPFRPTSVSARRIRSALGDLIDWMNRFNQRWSLYLSERNLSALNELRDGYNRYYVLEKECALRSARLARQGFVPMAPYTVQELLTQFPLLPVVQTVHS